jgi:predicted DNA-binding antitoxin AbrB/MazE fold protein
MTEKPSVTLPGTVEKVIKSANLSEPEKAQISIEGADDLYREIRIENSLTDENGDQVSLKKGAEVEVTVEADKDATSPKSKAKK